MALARTLVATLLAGLVVPLATAPASAQEQPVVEPQAAPPEYDAAFAALARGDRDEARRQLTIVAARGSADPWGRRALELLQVLQPGGRAPTPTSEARDEVPTRGARAELALFQTVFGVAAGIETCLALDCESGTAALFLAMAGGGIGLGAALAATPGGIHPGHMDLIDSGTAWGYWHGAALTAILDVDSSQRASAALLLGQGAGTALGVAFWPALRPTAGQMSLANTIGGWSLALTLFSHGAFFDFDRASDEILGSLLVAGDLGLVVGGVLASQVHTTRGRMLLIDAGGILGVLAGAGTAVLIEGDDISRDTYFQSMIPGALLGLGAAAWLTRDWDAPDMPATLAIVPTEAGASAVLSGTF